MATSGEGTPSIFNDKFRSATWPRLELGTFEKTSDKDEGHNCVAFAVGDKSRWWEPETDLAYWPEGAVNEGTVEGYVSAFRTQGFELCDNPDVEPGYEKIALYARDEQSPTHAAVQWPNGKWRSKVGELEDIEHAALDVLECDDYGRVAALLKRPRRQ